MADIYEYKFQDKLNGDWKRLRFLKPDGTTKIESPVIEYLPYGSINLGKYKYAFDKRPIGLPLAPTQQITIDLQLCPTEFNSWFFNSSYTLNNQYFNVYFELSYASSENGVYSKFFVGSLKRGVEIEYPLDYDRITIDFVDLIKIGLDNVNFNDFIDYFGVSQYSKSLYYWNKTISGINYEYSQSPEFTSIGYLTEYAFGSDTFIWHYINVKLNDYLLIASRGYYELNDYTQIKRPNIDYFRQEKSATLVDYSNKLNNTELYIIGLIHKIDNTGYIGGIAYKTQSNVKDDYSDYPEALGNYKNAWDLINDLYIDDGGIAKLNNGIQELTPYNSLYDYPQLFKGAFKSTPKLLLHSNVIGKLTRSLSYKRQNDSDSFEYTAVVNLINDSSDSQTEVLTNCYLANNEINLFVSTNKDIYSYTSLDNEQRRGIFYLDSNDNKFYIVNPIVRKTFFNGQTISAPTINILGTKTRDISIIQSAFNSYLYQNTNKDDLIYYLPQVQSLCKSNVIANGILDAYSDNDMCKLSGAILLKDFYKEFMIWKNFDIFKYDIANVYNLPETQNIPSTWIVKSFEIDWNSGLVEIEAFSFKGAI